MPVKIIRYTDLTEDPVKQEAIKQRVLQQYGAESPMGRKALVKPQDFGIAVGDDGKASLLHLPDPELLQNSIRYFLLRYCLTHLKK